MSLMFCNYASGRSYKSYKNFHSKELQCQPYIRHIHSSDMPSVVGSAAAGSSHQAAGKMRSERHCTSCRDHKCDGAITCAGRGGQSLQMYWPPNYKKPLCQNYIISNMIHFSAMVSYVLCLFLFSFFLSFFGFEFGFIWQLLVFNMVFSLMLNDMHITLETWELISFANIFIIWLKMNYGILLSDTL